MCDSRLHIDSPFLTKKTNDIKNGVIEIECQNSSVYRKKLIFNSISIKDLLFQKDERVTTSYYTKLLDYLLPS